VQSPYTIAVIDDEQGIQKTLAHALRAAGYNAVFFSSGGEALERLSEQAPDLIVLDIMMPGIDGITFCSLFRKEHPLIPIIFLSSRADELSRIEALERGGDDYLTKPFSLKELLVRIGVCLRRVERYRTDEAAAPADAGGGPFVVDTAGWRVHLDGRALDFSVTEFRIFTALLSRPGTVFTREQLMKKAYPEDTYVSDRNVDMHITRIRKKICAVQPAFDGIETVYGLGYRYRETDHA
jgi:two-component system response regulator ChvI